MTPLQAAREFERMALDLPGVARAAVADGLEIMLEDAQRLSSGMETQAQHDAKGNPYARKWGKVKPPNDDVIINIGVGDFLRDMAVEGPIESADVVAGAVVNFNEKADWLTEGTETLLGRDLPGAVEERTAEAVEAVIEARIERFFNR